MTIRNTDLGEYKGINKQSTIAQHYYRLLYNVTFSSVGPAKRDVRKSITNFEFSERIMYGRVNHEMIPIIPREAKMRELNSNGGKMVCRVFDFVELAFKNFQKAFQNAEQKGQISPDQGFLTFPEPKAGYVSPISHYLEYRTALYEIFSKKISKDKQVNVNITSFEDFIPYFDQFVEEATTKVPFTFSGFMRSRYSNVMMTGLAVDIWEGDASLDNKKVKRVYDNPNYPFYENMALQFGFSIDKNLPWRLVADLKSPAMIRYMNQLGYPNLASIFSNHYETAHLVGYNNFKSLFAIYYNSFVQNYPTVVTPYLQKSGKYISKRTYRQTVNLIELNLKYGEQWFLEKYAQIRNLEESSPLSVSRVSQVVDRANKLGKIKNKEDCLYMINKNFAVTDHLPGSLAEKTTNRQNKKNTKDDQDLQQQRKPGSLSY
tara:strand:- start:726 stop:2018 length:1293 start_codon:yes stop_codon:yes gene_type:complete